MKKKITPIAMKCNKEQFEAIKPKLEGIEIYSVTCFNEFPYLINYDNGIELSNIDKYTFKNKIIHAEEIHETWNERIFLQACGIETEETFEITKETIIKYKMKDEFPEVFEVKLEVGKWYKKHDKAWHLFLFCFSGTYGNKTSYGFDALGKWSEKLGVHKSGEYVKATEQEVFEALKNEAVRRYKKNDCITGLYRKQEGFLTFEIIKNGLEHIYVDEWNSVWMSIGNRLNEKVFDNGTWAKIIPTKTKEEAEKLLGVKIIS